MEIRLAPFVAMEIKGNYGILFRKLRLISEITLPPLKVLEGLPLIYHY